MSFNFPNAPVNGQTFTPTGGVTYTWNSTTAAWQLTSATSSLVGYAPLNSPVFTGDPQAPTPSAGDSDTSIATTAFVASAITAIGIGNYAPLASPLFTGDPRAPTPATADNDTSIATTAFVKAQAYLTDAPNDGLTYGRRSNAWATIVGGAVVSDTAPTGILQNGQMWYESDTGSLYLYYTDADSSQWVMVVPGSPGMPKATGNLDMQGYSIINDLNITGTGTATFATVTSTGNVNANQNFVAATTAAVLAATGAGNVFLRPNGAGSTVGQIQITASGQITAWAQAGGNSAVAYADETGAVKGYTYWNRSDNSLRMYHQPSGGVVYVDSGGNTNVNLGLVVANSIKPGSSSGGFFCKRGINGAYSNIFNYFWNNAAMEQWVDGVNTGSVSVTSDYRVKKDVENLPSMWETVRKLRPISYTQAEFKPLFDADNKPRWGFIAHELQETMILDAATGVKDMENLVQSPNPWTIIAALTKTVQEMQDRIEALEAR